MGSTPVASGSRVPAWPAFLAEKARLTTDTAWVDVMPIGLSSTSQPSTLRFSRLRGGLPGTCVGSLTVASIVFAGALEIAPDRGRSQKLLDSFRFVESLVEAEGNVRCKFQVNAAGNLAAQEAPVAIESFQHRLLVSAAQRHHVNGRLPKVGTHAYLRHRNHVTFEHRIMHLAARQDFGERMTHQLPGAQLALRRAGFLLAMMSAWHKIAARWLNGGPGARR